jgi:hypothetical protein
MKNKKSLWFNKKKKGFTYSNSALLQIILDTECTKINFGDTAKEIYIKRGEVRMEQNTFYINKTNWETLCNNLSYWYSNQSRVSLFRI